jgi:hypothetical protein
MTLHQAAAEVVLLFLCLDDPLPHCMTNKSALRLYSRGTTARGGDSHRALVESQSLPRVLAGLILVDKVEVRAATSSYLTSQHSCSRRHHTPEGSLAQLPQPSIGIGGTSFAGLALATLPTILLLTANPTHPLETPLRSSSLTTTSHRPALRTRSTTSGMQIRSGSLHRPSVSPSTVRPSSRDAGTLVSGPLP